MSDRATALAWKLEQEGAGQIRVVHVTQNDVDNADPHLTYVQNLANCETVFSRNPDESWEAVSLRFNAFLDNLRNTVGLERRNRRHELFGGYWVDGNGDTYHRIL